MCSVTDVATVGRGDKPHACLQSRECEARGGDSQLHRAPCHGDEEEVKQDVAVATVGGGNRGQPFQLRRQVPHLCDRRHAVCLKKDSNTRSVGKMHARWVTFTLLCLFCFGARHDLPGGLW